jgi:hypothetical protein
MAKLADGALIGALSAVLCATCKRVPKEKTVFVESRSLWCSSECAGASEAKQTPIPEDLQDLYHDQIIHCPKSDDGCQWTGPLSTLDHHHQYDCLEALISCASAECKAQVPRRLEEYHRRNCLYLMEPCSFCRQLIRRSDLKTHIDICRDEVVPCTEKECEWKGPRKEMHTHLTTECQFYKVACRFASVGCESTGTLAQRKQHEIDFAAIHKLYEEDYHRRQKEKYS